MQPGAWGDAACRYFSIIMNMNMNMNIIVDDDDDDDDDQ